MLFYRGEPGLRASGRILALAEALSVPPVAALGHVHALYGLTCEPVYEQGVLTGLSPEALARLCLWYGQAEGFVGALLAGGFLRVKGGWYEVVGWREMHEAFFASDARRRSHRDRQKRYRDRQRDADSGAPRDADGGATGDAAAGATGDAPDRQTEKPEPEKKTAEPSAPPAAPRGYHHAAVEVFTAIREGVPVQHALARLGMTPRQAGELLGPAGVRGDVGGLVAVLEDMGPGVRNPGGWLRSEVSRRYGGNGDGSKG